MSVAISPCLCGNTETMVETDPPLTTTYMECPGCGRVVASITTQDAIAMWNGAMLANREAQP